MTRTLGVLTALLCGVCSSVLGSPLSTLKLFEDWKPYTSELVIPEVVDMRGGGRVTLSMGLVSHNFQSGLDFPTSMYGFAVEGTGKYTYPGPTILARRGVPLSMTWENDLPSPHLLDSHIDRSFLLAGPSSCYPD